MSAGPKIIQSLLKLAILPWILSACFLSNPTLLFGQRAREAGSPKGKWERLENCRLVNNSIVDGDSFHVLHKKREYIFRLYFVDTPESDSTQPERITDQAAYFGIVEGDIPRAGDLAAKFTREKLMGRDFTVVTRWENALGRSSLARYYAVVLLGETNLAEELIANGLARINGPRADWNEKMRSATFINQLKNKELSAREQRRGVWDERAFPRKQSSPNIDVAGTNVAASPASNSPALIDLNTATFEELVKLRGIGKKLAERIISNRPYKKVDDLDKVKGIGSKTIKKLRPRVRVEAKSR